MIADCTVISCLYGETHLRFLDDWMNGVRALNPMPAAVIVTTESDRDCSWSYPQPFYLQAAFDLAETTWVWVHDIDDVAFPDALEGLEDVTADVWQFGYVRSDGEEYIPPKLTAAEVLAAARNPFVAGSCIRTEKLRKVGGFPDVALQDWALWRALARADATFCSSTRPHFRYRRHPDTRGVRELTAGRRADHLAEMMEAELVTV